MDPGFSKSRQTTSANSEETSRRPGESGSADLDDEVTEFMSVTGCLQLDVARYYLLEVCGGDLDAAVSCYLESETGDFPRSSSAAAESVVAEGGDRNAGGAGKRKDENKAAKRQEKRAKPVERDVRPPDPVFTQQLIGNEYTNKLQLDFPDGTQRGTEPVGNSMSSSGICDTEGEQAFSNLFAPPKQLLFPGTFTEAKVQARRLQRWLLVNIQKVDVFACHLLNRDVWSDEVIAELIGEWPEDQRTEESEQTASSEAAGEGEGSDLAEDDAVDGKGKKEEEKETQDEARSDASGNFLLWQRDCELADAKEYCQLYQVTAFPHIAVIDPRTGQAVQKWRGTVFGNALDAQGALLDFLERQAGKANKRDEEMSGFERVLQVNPPGDRKEQPEVERTKRQRQHVNGGASCARMRQSPETLQGRDGSAAGREGSAAGREESARIRGWHQQIPQQSDSADNKDGHRFQTPASGSSNSNTSSSRSRSRSTNSLSVRNYQNNSEGCLRFAGEGVAESSSDCTGKAEWQSDARDGSSAGSPVYSDINAQLAELNRQRRQRTKVPTFASQRETQFQ